MRKFIGVMTYGIGLTILIFSLFSIFSIFSTYSGVKFFSSLIHIFFSSRFFPPFGTTVVGITMLILGLFSIFLGWKVFPPFGTTVVGITMLILGLFSIFLGWRFFSYSWLQLYYRVTQILILSSGLVYIISGVFLFRLKNWVRKLTIYYSIILILYFFSLSIFLIPVPLGGGPVMVFTFSPYMTFPLFLIIFLTHSRVKEQFKK